LFVMLVVSVDKVRSIVLSFSINKIVEIKTFDSWVNNHKAISSILEIIKDVFWCTTFVADMCLVLVAMACISMTHSHRAREVIFFFFSVTSRSAS
jgi:hypothetical protein